MRYLMMLLASTYITTTAHAEYFPVRASEEIILKGEILAFAPAPAENHWFRYDIKFNNQLYSCVTIKLEDSISPRCWSLGKYLRK